MSIRFREYQGEDFIRIRDFLVSAYQQKQVPSNWLIDRWNFVRHFSQVMHNTFEEWPKTVGMWEDEQGNFVSVVCSEGEQCGEAFFQMLQYDLPEELLKAMFEYAENKLALQEKGKRQLHLRLPENAPHIAEMASQRGYVRGSWSEGISVMDISDPLEVLLPEGFEIQSGRQLADEAQGIAHAKAFGYMETEYAQRSPLCYTMVKQAPDYRSDLDLAVVNPEGEIVSFCTVWYDKVNKIGILEPVGTHPEYRRRGLGKGVIYEGVNRILQEGAGKMYVGTDKEFYLRIGFNPVFHLDIWDKTIEE